MREEKELPYSELTRTILQCCFEVMKELGVGFLENVYKNALFIAIKQTGMKVLVEQKYEIVYRRLHHPNHSLLEAKIEAILPWEKEGSIT